MIPISAVIITFNEERNIGRCLDSLAGVVDEIVVVDSGSADATAAICREKGVRFIEHPFLNFSHQKNFATNQARFDWILSLDADEALTSELQSSILAVKNNPAHDAYRMNRLTSYCGQWIRHSGWYPDDKVRLFDRRKGRWGGPNPHEKVILSENATTGFLAGDLLHYSYYTEQEHFERARTYALMAAAHMKARGRRGAWWRMYLSPVAKFIRNYILRRGFLDGRAGLRIGYVSALETYWKYRELAKAAKSRSE